MASALNYGLRLRAGRARGLAVACCLGLLLAGCKDDLYSGLSQRDANEMMAILATAGVAASRDLSENGTYVLRVEKDSFPAATKILSEHGYPRDKFRSVGELFPGTSMIISPFEQRTRYLYALNQELTQTVAEFEGVVSARVHVALPEREASLVTAPVKPSASVVIHHRPEAHAEQLASHARNVVATAVPGLDIRNVSVALVPAKGSPRPAGLQTAGGGIAQAAVVETSSGFFGILRMVLAAGAVLAAALGLLHLARSAGLRLPPPNGGAAGEPPTAKLKQGGN